MDNTSELEYLKKRINDLESRKPSMPDVPRPEEEFGTIPQKTCAAEVYNHLKLSRTYAIGSLVAILAVAFTAPMGMFLSGGIAVICMLPAGIYFSKVNGTLKYLEQKYRF